MTLRMVCKCRYQILATAVTCLVRKHARRVHHEKVYKNNYGKISHQLWKRLMGLLDSLCSSALRVKKYTNKGK